MHLKSLLKELKMKGKTPPPPDYRKLLVIGVPFVNIAIIVLVGIFIRRSRLPYEERATTTTQNLSQVIEEYVSGVIARIDVALLSVADESERQLSGGNSNRRDINTFLVQQRARLPELDALLITNANGEIVYGTDVTPGSLFNVADRNYFIHLRDDPGSGVVISHPIVGRVSGKWIMTMARRLNHPDGSFAGVVLGTIALERFAETFSRVNVGKHGIIVLLDNDRSVICRYTETHGTNSGIGKQYTSAEIQELFRRGVFAATYRTRSTIDGVYRTHSYRKVSSYPIYVVVGLASDDYLAEWRNDVAKMLALLALILCISFFLAWMLYRHITRRRQAEEEIRQSEEKYRQVINLSYDAVVIFDTESGKVIEVNKAAETLYGYSQEEFLNLSHIDMTAEPNASGLSVRQTIDEKHVYFPLRMHRKKDGTSFPVEISASSFMYKGRKLICGCVRDITGRTKAEEDLAGK